MSAAFAAAVSASRFASGSLGCRRLMIDAKPIFLISGIAWALVAPAQATVVSRRLKLVTPSTVSFDTSCARAGAAANHVVAIKTAPIGKCDFMAILQRGSFTGQPNRLHFHSE